MEDDRKFDAEVRELYRAGKLSKGSIAKIPRYQSAFCARCGRQIIWEEFGLTAYEGKSWHDECLKRWLIKRIDRLLALRKRTGHDYEQLAEYQEALETFRGEG